MWAIYEKIAHRDALPDAQGRITLKPGLVSLLLGAFSAVFACGLGYFTLSAVFNPIDDRLFFLLTGPPITALMTFAAFIILWTRVRVSDQGVEHRGLTGWKSFPWDKVKNVDAHDILGPRINVIDHRRLYFWPYGYGQSEVRDIIIAHDKPYSLA